METKDAIVAFAALAQESRLKAFRLLVRSGAQGLPAGEIARRLGVPHNTMSTHLAALTQAGLLTSRREGRTVTYAVDLAGTRALLAFLLEDCCQGRPELCAPVLASVLPGCCETEPGRLQ